MSPSALAELLKMVRDGTISRTIAKDVFKEMYRKGGSAEEIARKKGLIQISSEVEIAPIVEQAIRENPDQVNAYKRGKAGYVEFLSVRLWKELTEWPFQGLST